MNIYCTYVTFYSGNKLPPFYIGSTSVEKIATGYHGSVRSKKWRLIYESELKNNNHLFNSEIILKFDTRKEALENELELQKSNNVVKSPWFFNEAFATVNGFFGRLTKGYKRGPNTNPKKPVTEETRRRMSESRMGFIHSPETIQKILETKRIRGTNRISKETRIKMSAAKKGVLKQFTKEHIAALKCHENNITTISCPHCGKMGQLPNMKRWHFEHCKLITQSQSDI